MKDGESKDDKGKQGGKGKGKGKEETKKGGKDGSKGKEKEKKKETPKPKDEEDDWDMLDEDDDSAKSKAKSKAKPKEEKKSEVAPIVYDEKVFGRSSDDLAYLAIFFLKRWVDYGIRTEAAKVLSEVVSDVSIDFVNNPKTDVQNVNDARWQYAKSSLLELAGLTHYSPDSEKEKEYVAQALAILCATVKSYPIAEREARLATITRLENLARAIPVIGNSEFRTTVDEEARIFKPLTEMNDFFWGLLITRKCLRFHLESKSLDDFVQKAKPLLHHMVEFVSSYPAFHPHQITGVKESSSTLISRSFDWNVDNHHYQVTQIGRAVQQECRDRSRMPSSA
eukprot:TRINITY_DN11786_c0_g1_i9.p1 TRINITY_DN11786_c0_g1~~TRINITY_DN11786_c0_g1_i9.p1  ORF type:complete len:380 (+),score=91.63 TRINITY_DN11786_c0_g1_i9:127-1140(+)